MDRVFHSLLQRVGDEGRYQVIILIIGSILCFQFSSTSVFNTFLFYQDDFQCPSNITNCHQYVCSLPHQQQTAYINPSFSSMLSRFGNYRCDMGGFPMTAQMIIYLGSIVSTLLAAFLAKYLRSKHVLMLTIVMALLGVTLTLLSTSLVMTTVGLFINFTSRGMQQGISFSYLSQSTSENIRTKYTLCLCLGFALGSTLVGLAFALIKPWQLALIIYSIVPMLAVLIVSYLCVADTPFDAVTKNEPSQALQQFRLIASINKVECNIVEHQIVEIQREFYQSQSQLASFTVSWLDLLRYSSLRWTTIMCFGLKMMMNLALNGPALVLRDLPVNIYLNCVVTSSGQLFVTLISFPIVPYLSRKKVQITSWAVATLIATLLFTFFPCQQRDNCSDWSKRIQTTGLFLYRMIVAMAMNSFVLSTTEVFPAQIKTIALQVIQLGNALAFFVIPPIQIFLESKQVSILVLFIVVGIVAIGLTIGLKETKGIPPPQMIEELRQRADDIG